MGTQYHITIINNNDHPKKHRKNLKKEIDRLLLNLNQQMSTYINSSEISRFNRYTKTDWFSVSEDFAYVVDAALKISQQTTGAFDITVSPLIELWGFGSKTQYSIPTKKQIAEIMPYIGFQHLSVRTKPAAIRKDNSEVHIDLSAIAKGFAVDKISDFLSTEGFDNYLVEIGGEVRASGKNISGKQWRIAIEQPNRKQNAINKVISVSNKALATSGDYRNYYIKDKVRYSHTIDPTTGAPIKHQLASVTVVTPLTMYADAYATAFMVMGDKQGKSFAKKHKLNVNFIIRETEGIFTTWSSLSENEGLAE